MEFTWDENKNNMNQLKHKISFNQATEVFKDKARINTPDIRFDYGEERWITIGLMYKAIVLVVYTISSL